MMNGWISYFKLGFIVFTVFTVTSCCREMGKKMIVGNKVSVGELGNLRPGDTLILNAGIYDIELFANIPSGKNWEKPIVIKALKGDEVIFRPNKGNRVLHFGKYFLNNIPVHHIEVEGLILDAINVKSDAVKITNGAHHIRIKNCEIRNSKNQGILITELGSNYNEIINCKIYNNGLNDFDHGIYVSTDYNIIKNCEIYDNAGSGINLYNGKLSANFNQVLNCHIHNNARVGRRGAGIGMHTGKGNIAKHNLIHNNNTGIHTDYGSSGTLIENNIIYDHPGYCLIVGLNAGNYKLVDNIILKESSFPVIQIKKQYPQTLEGQLIISDRADLINKVQKKLSNNSN